MIGSTTGLLIDHLPVVVHVMLQTSAYGNIALGGGFEVYVAKSEGLGQLGES